MPLVEKADYGKGLKETFFPFPHLPNFERVKRRFTVTKLLYLLVKFLDNLQDYIFDVIFHKICKTPNSTVLLKFTRIFMLPAFFASLRTSFSGLIKFDKTAEKKFGNFVRCYQCFLNREQRVWLNGLA